MKCNEVKLLLVEYYENSLDLDDRSRVKQHLSGCESCRFRLKQIEQLHQLLAKENVPSPEESFWTNFLPEVRSRIKDKKKPRGILIPKTRLAFGLLSVVAVVIISLILFTTDRRNMVEHRTEPMVETILSVSDPSSYTEQLAEMLSAQGELPLNVFLSNGETQDLELTEKILEQDLLSQKSLNSILIELSSEELKQLEESIKTLVVGDIL